MTAHSKITAAPSVFDARLADAWRESCLTVEDGIRASRQYLRIMAERDDKLSGGSPVHSAATVAKAEKLLPWRLSLYLEALRRVSEAEAKMTLIGHALRQIERRLESLTP